MDELDRARALKADIEKSITILESPVKKTSVKDNDDEHLENKLIQELRHNQQMSWADTASRLNQKRRKRSEAVNLTETAVYSRFVRSSPVVVTPIREIGFDSRDYIHLRHPNQHTQAEGTGTTSRAGKKRVKNYDNATELRDNVRSKVSADEHKELESVKRTEQLMEAVARVERNFWVFVADEMERATTKMYQPEELARRYHAV